MPTPLPSSFVPPPAAKELFFLAKKEGSPHKIVNDAASETVQQSGEGKNSTARGEESNMEEVRFVCCCCSTIPLLMLLLAAAAGWMIACYSLLNNWIVLPRTDVTVSRSATTTMLSLSLCI